MNNQEHFGRSVKALVKAFFNGTLARMSCAACACGNIIADANELTIIPAGYNYRGDMLYMWKECGFNPATYMGEDAHNLWSGHNTLPNTREMLNKAGYTKQQLAEVERAFMGWGKYSDEGGDFEALLRTVDCLAEFHQIDLTTAEAAKALFVRA